MNSEKTNITCDPKKDIILRTATKHFAKAGFDGARVDEIAKEAGVNKATLYYRIGNKEAIYEALFVQLIGKVLSEIEQKTQTKKTAEEQLISFTEAFAQSLEDNIYIAPLILQEIASGGAHMNDKAIEKMNQIRGVLTTILKKGESDGSFQPTNPFLIHILLIGTLNFYSASASIRNKISLCCGNDSQSFISPVSSVATEIVNFILNSIKTNS